jgi:T5SS/PEP-CTERM-associated repeat protein
MVSNSDCYIGYGVGSTGAVTVEGPGSTWTNSSELFVGYNGSGTLNITNGGAVGSDEAYLGYYPGAIGTVTVDGPGSTWTNILDDEYLYIGYEGSGTLNITNGGAVSSETCKIGLKSGSTGEVTVAGPGSAWTNSSELFVGNNGSGTINITSGGAVINNGYASIGSTGEVTVDGPGSTWTNGGDLYAYGTLNITNGGRVIVAGTLTTYENGFINLAGGGMLALYGTADESLVDFLLIVGGTDAIRYWDDSISDWADITGATYGQDYTLSFLTEGDLAGYTMLTVPEPAALSLLILGSVTMIRRRRSP